MVSYLIFRNTSVLFICKPVYCNIVDQMDKCRIRSCIEDLGPKISHKQLDLDLRRRFDFLRFHSLSSMLVDFLVSPSGMTNHHLEVGLPVNYC